MLVCHCYGVTDRDIRAAVRRGDDALIAGTGCGNCRPAVDAIAAAEAHAMTAACPRRLPVVSGDHSPAFFPVNAAARPE